MRTHLCARRPSVDALVSKINSMFTDKAVNLLTLSTIPKAKGLEVVYCVFLEQSGCYLPEWAKQPGNYDKRRI
jgi:hypothetical protein